VIQKQIFFLNNFVIAVSIVFVIIFFIPIFRVDLPLDYKISDSKLIINVEKLDIEKDLFVNFKDNDVIIINRDNGNLEIDKSNICNNQIILDIQQLNTGNELRVYYKFKKSVMDYIIKSRKM
jgi:ribosomal protein L21